MSNTCVAGEREHERVASGLDPRGPVCVTSATNENHMYPRKRE